MKRGHRSPQHSGKIEQFIGSLLLQCQKQSTRVILYVGNRDYQRYQFDFTIVV